MSEIDIKREHISDSIFDALALYVVEQNFHDFLKNLTKENLKPIQDEVEKLLTQHGFDVK